MPRCPEHLTVEHPPACGPCRDARQAREAWDTAQARRVAEGRARKQRANARLRADASAACSLCDDDGYRGTTLCTHEPPRSRPTLREQFEALRAETPAPTPEESHA
ncbi:hypothetical protein IU469_22115 [Nocardia puris]|uniref:hypothetical protein n=1 Tax=Nocardia puris TaxID=208602 RepID=UPI001893D358|nr:hypothetical protein [Nocardia puris]MBF6368395.1 hypothetical protein [Nocardia puris]